jgi:hypothetical protein
LFDANPLQAAIRAREAVTPVAREANVFEVVKGDSDEDTANARLARRLVWVRQAAVKAVGAADVCSALSTRMSEAHEGEADTAECALNSTVMAPSTDGDACACEAAEGASTPAAKPKPNAWEGRDPESGATVR